MQLAVGEDTVKKIAQMFGSKKEIEAHNNDFDQHCKDESLGHKEHNWTKINTEEQIKIDVGLHERFVKEQKELIKKEEHAKKNPATWTCACTLKNPMSVQVCPMAGCKKATWAALS